MINLNIFPILASANHYSLAVRTQINDVLVFGIDNVAVAVDGLDLQDMHGPVFIAYPDLTVNLVSEMIGFLS